MPAEPIISDRNYQEHALYVPSGMSKGRVPRDYSRNPLGFGAGAKRASFDLIPEDQWPDLIADQERTKTRLSDIVRQAGVPSMDQNGTNYCWFNAVVTAFHALRAKNGDPYVALSAASGAAVIKGYSNQGGWGGEALDFFAKRGICEAKLWPTNAISRQYECSEVEENRKSHMITEWWDMDPGNFGQLITMLLNRMPVPVGLNWWGHEVCCFDAVVIANNGMSMKAWSQPYLSGNFQFGARFRNSWSDSYGDHGFGVLAKSKCIASDQCAPRVITPSVN